MGIIHKLSPALADMIAAGEVVERPASVIKELVENAVDAGAKKITVEIKNGGVTFMRVTDDGCGMSREDAPTAFLRHATSKISCAEDLGGISTMGFRGEALAAISSVSKIDLLTRAASENLGVSMRVEAGNVIDIQPAGCPQGTTMIVRDLFYNTPARMKFLKRDSVEGSYIGGAVQRQALGHPEIAFRFLRDGKPELTTPGDGKLLSAIYAAMGRASAKEMVEVKSTSGGVTVTGYVGKPTASRGSRSYQHFFVNGRYVKSRMMASALEEAYKNQIMVGRFPICVLHITVPPTAVDVNVHPAKTEVKFLREGDIFDAIHYSVLGALSRAQDRPEMELKSPRPQVQPKQNFYQNVTAQEYRTMTGMLEKSSSVQPSPAVRQQFRQTERTFDQNVSVHDSVRMVPSVGGAKPAPTATAAGSDALPKEEKTAWRPEPTIAREPEPMPEEPISMPIPEPVPEPEPIQPVQTVMDLPEMPVPKAPEPQAIQEPELQSEQPYRIIGEALDTYIIVEQGDGLLLFDKHAAHERIRFERLKAQRHEVMSQILLSPLHPSMSREEVAVLLENKETMEGLGFTLEDFGGDLVVRAIPCDVTEEDAPACLSELAQQLQDGRKLDRETVYDDLLHTIACKGAIKGGQYTDPKEISALVAELMARDDIKHCPHGRPVCITLSRATLERQFKRT